MFDMTNIEGDDTQPAIISTGIDDIDKKLGGGIPIGSLTLIEGQSGSGKSVLSQQFTWGSLWGDHRVVQRSGCGNLNRGISGIAA